MTFRRSCFGIFLAGAIGIVSGQMPQECTSQRVPRGIVGPQRRNTILESAGMILAAENGQIQCSGKITKWYVSSTTVPAGQLDLQVWRPLADGTYLLVGENSTPLSTWKTINGGNAFELDVADLDSISVRKGDMIGWRSSLTRRHGLYYEECLDGSSHCGLILRSDNCVAEVNRSCNFSRFCRRNYSVAADIEADGAPSFTNLEPHRTLLVQEDSPAGTFFYTVRAVPRMTWAPSIPHEVHYRISHADHQTCMSLFAIGDTNGSLVTTQALSKKSLYPASRRCNLTISAGTSDGRMSKGNITVLITPVNRPHSFRRTDFPSSTTIEASFDTTNFQIKRFEVNDSVDEYGPLSAVTSKTFHIVGAFPDAGIFKVERIGPLRNDGRVVCTRDLRFWKGPTYYEVNLTSVDDQYGTEPETLRVNIINLRRPPVLTRPPATVSMRENQVKGREICNVSASLDPVTDSADEYEYSITQYPRSEAALFKLVKRGRKFSIHFVNPRGMSPALDYTRIPEYQVEVTVRDRQMNYVDRANLTVQIVRVNQPPYFTARPLAVNFSIPEELPVYTEVPSIKLHVYDRDLPLGDTFTLSIQQSRYSQHFYTKRNSDKLYISRRMNIDPYRSSVTVEFHVRVLDAAGEYHKNYGTIPVSIHVMDVNDNAPCFKQTSFTSSIPENTNFTHVLGTFTATDQDWGDNARVVYSIRNNATGARGDYFFTLDADSGELRVQHPVDYEQFTEIRFWLVATDLGQPSLSGFMEVCVKVEDVNDNRPKFTKHIYNIEIPSNLPPHSTVTAVSATDADTSVNSVIYSLLGGSGGFSLNNNTGEITTKRHLPSGQRYLLACHARDHGTLSDSSVVRIDTFDAGSHLIDITFGVRLKDFDKTIEKYLLQRLHKVIRPWIIKVWKKEAFRDRTVVTLYSIEDSSTDSKNNLGMIKHFVHRDRLLSRLKGDIYGTPSEALRGPAFAVFHPVYVGPTHPVWVVETVPGLLTLTAIVLTVVTASAMSISLAVCKLKKNHRKKEISRSPNSPKGPSTKESLCINQKGDSDKAGPEVQKPVVTPISNVIRPRTDRPHKEA